MDILKENKAHEPLDVREAFSDVAGQGYDGTLRAFEQNSNPNSNPELVEAAQQLMDVPVVSLARQDREHQEFQNEMRDLAEFSGVEGANGGRRGSGSTETAKAGNNAKSEKDKKKREFNKFLERLNLLNNRIIQLEGDIKRLEDEIEKTELELQEEEQKLGEIAEFEAAIRGKDDNARITEEDLDKAADIVPEFKGTKYGELKPEVAKACADQCESVDELQQEKIEKNTELEELRDLHDKALREKDAIQALEAMDISEEAKRAQLEEIIATSKLSSSLTHNESDVDAKVTDNLEMDALDDIDLEELENSTETPSVSAPIAPGMG